MKNVRKMIKEDAKTILSMMETFYASDAVFTNGSQEIFRADVEACISDNPYLEGWVFTDGEKLIGYSMLAKSFSTEFGKRCIWIEDLYVLPPYRSSGLGRSFLQHIQQLYPGALFRLEAEQENEGAVRLYERMGFEVLPYLELKK